MSGHSKWSKVKHQKESVDANRGKIFTKLSNAIFIAVKEDGGIADPETNFKLRIAVDRAKSLNMPKDNIERAIERATSVKSGISIESRVYEAFAPGGVGLIIEAVTDNKQRTVSDIKNILERAGGRLASSGAVIHLFKWVGKIEIPKGSYSFDKVLEIAINSGSTDIGEKGEYYEVYTVASDLHKVKKNLLSLGVPISFTELIYQPKVKIDTLDPKTIEKIENIKNKLDDNEDVQKVYSNYS